MKKSVHNWALAAALALLTCPPLFASEEDAIIHSFDRPLTVYLFTSTSSLYLDILPSYWDDALKLKSNDGTSAGAGISYRDFGVKFSGSMLGKKESSSERGRTEYRDLYFSHGSRRHLVTAHYQDYRGFYFDNPGRMGMDTKDPETVLPSLEVRQFAVNASWNFRKNFSMSAFTDHSERQNISDWSHMLMASYTAFSIRNEAPIIPGGAAGVPDDVREYSGGTYHTVSLQPGIGGTLAARRFYLTGFMLMGGGIMLHDSDTGEGDSLQFGSMFKMFLGMAMGYNGDSFFSGLRFTGDTTETSNINGYQLTTSSYHMECVVGCRFYSGII